MAIEKKERYVIRLADGKAVTALAQSFQECIALFGEENIEMIRKFDYEEPEEET